MKREKIRVTWAPPGKEPRSVTAEIPRYKSDEWIKTQFPALLMVKYNEDYCSFERIEFTG